jgi:hypothetical protein
VKLVNSTAILEAQPVQTAQQVTTALTKAWRLLFPVLQATSQHQAEHLAETVPKDATVLTLLQLQLKKMIIYVQQDCSVILILTIILIISMIDALLVNIALKALLLQ